MQHRHIIAYDIGNPRRLRRVSRICEDYGSRLQKSVFECNLPDALLQEMMQRLEEVIDLETDRVIEVPVCAACNEGRKVLGPATSGEIPDVWVA